MKSGANKIPILTFHALEDANTPISFPPALFERAIKKWHAAGWRTISLCDAARHLRERMPVPAKSFVITFDDGYASVYREGFLLLEGHQMTATVFVAPAERVAGRMMPLPTLNGREMLAWNEIREMRAHGFTFGAHTLTHHDLTRMEGAGVTYELRESQSILSDALGEKIALFAYPFGRHNRQVRQIVAQLFEVACSDELGIANFDSDPFALERVEMYYLRAAWSADGLLRRWFPFYLAMRNIPRRMRRAAQR